MKPIELIVSAFGPYSDKMTLSMEQLGAQGIFLITGDTGAGKTSIFDAICFALFGEVSGSQRAADQLRSDFADPMVETFVHLRFTHAGEEYCIHRTPKYERPKKRGTGMVTQNANAVLTRPDGSTIAGATTVTEEIEGILGVGCQSFKQISMIAQGEFMKLLTADSRVRAEVIRRVFHTEPLVQLQKQIKAEYLEWNRRCADARRAVEQYAEGFRLAEGSPFAGHTEEIDLSTLLESVRRQNAEDEKQLQADKKQLEGLRQAQTNAIEAVVQAKRDNETREKWLTAREQKQKLTAQLPDIQQEKQRMDQAHRARDIVLPKWNVWQTEQRREQQMCESVERRKQALRGLEQRTPQIQQMQEQAKQAEPRIAVLEREITRLTDAQEQVVYWKQACQQAKRAEQQVQTLQKQAEEKIAQRDQGSKAIEQARMQLEDFQTVQTDLVRLRAEWEKSHTVEKQMESALKLFDAWETCSRDLVQEQKACLNLEQQFVLAEQAYRNSELAWNRGQAGILAQSLCDGIACPVCGSEKHPAPAKLAEDAPTEQQLKQFKQNMEQARKKYQEQSIRCSEYRTKELTAQDAVQRALEELFDDTNRTRQDVATALAVQRKITIQLAEDGKQLARREKQGKLLRKKYQEMTERQPELERTARQAEQDYQQAVTQAVRARTAAQQLRTSIPFDDLDALGEKLQSCQKDKADLYRKIEEAQKAWNTHQSDLISTQELLKSETAQLKQYAQTTTAAAQEWKDALYEAGFATGEAFQRARMEQTELLQMENHIQQFERNFAATTSVEAEYEAAAKEIHPADLVQLTQARKQAEDACRACEAEIHQRAERVQTNQRILQRIDEVRAQQSELEQQTAALRELSQTANGELIGKQKIMLEQYVQAAYFERVLQRANLRLRDMTQGRYAMQRRRKAENNRSQSGLDIDVMDYYTGKCRSVKTLSGGESFLGALALALGMSDVVQSYAGGVRVETVFIDEGFGSLDSAALEQAISVLVRLSDGDRLIGIISHVTELKDRIGRQIVVNRGTSGSTARMIVE